MSSDKPYRPGSGTEGMAFDDAWCSNCALDAAYRASGDDADPEDGCKILADTFAYDIDHPNYPKEWVYGCDGCPRCTAFVREDGRAPRCDKTADMFAVQQ